MEASLAFKEDLKAYKKCNDECSRQTEYITILERRLRQLKQRKTTLEKVFAEDTDARSRSTSEIEESST